MAPLEPAKAFAAIRSAWEAGRPIVPLFGAGISVGSAVPLTPQLTDYLVKVHVYAGRKDYTDASQYLLSHGWPSPHSLNIELAQLHRVKPHAGEALGPGRADPGLAQALQAARTEIAYKALAFEVKAASPMLDRYLEHVRNRSRQAGDAFNDLQLTGGDWLSALHLITGGRQSLIDSLFDRLVRDRRPHGCHQFISFLAQLMNWRLLLTTNFDELIEVALRDEGLAPVVYELTLQASLPDPRLVRQNLAVVKLHGGAFGLRAGFDLNEAMDDRSQSLFLKYLPEDALILVLGYGGADLRVMSLLDAFAKEGSGDKLKLLWVSHGDRAPGFLEETRRLSPSAVSMVVYRDGALFAQEMYYRIRFAHPPSRTRYRALYYPHYRYANDAATDRREPVALPDDRPLVFLQGDLQGYNARRDLVNCYDSASGSLQKLWFNLYEHSSLAAFLEELLLDLRRFDRSLPPMAAAVAYPRDGPHPPGEADALRQCELWHHWIAHALHRRSYLIAIDAVDSFASDHPAARPARDRDSKNLAGFFRGLWKHLRRDVASRILVATNDAQLAPDDSIVVPVLPWVAADGGEWLPRASFGPEQKALLAIASCFRRPRSVVALVKLYSKLIGNAAFTHAFGVQRPGDGGVPFYVRVEGWLRDMAKESVPFVGQEGGFYSFHRRSRDDVYDQLRASLERVPGLLDQIHDEIADYYRVTLYQQSHDIAAYMEYVFHRLAFTGPGRDQRLLWLTADLERERRGLIGRGHASALLDALGDVLRSVEEMPGADAPKRVLLRRVERMRAEIWHDIACFQESERSHLASAHVDYAQLAERLSANRSSGALDLQSLDAARSDAAVAARVGACRMAHQVVSESAQGRQAADLVKQAKDEASRVARSCERQSGLAAARDIRRRARDLQLDSLHTLMDSALRAINPWTSPSPAAAVVFKRVDAYWENAVESFRTFGSGRRIATLQSLVRCARARRYYLDSQFDRAQGELNRAHAFATHAAYAGDQNMLAIYYLHHAEARILEARQLPEPSKAAVLLASARTSLNQAETCLLNGRRDVFWWGRLNSLRARLELESLRMLARERGLGSGKRPGREEEAWKVPLVAGLAAVARGLASVYQSAQREAFLNWTWSELEVEWRRCTGSEDNRQWNEWLDLKEQAGLHDCAGRWSLPAVGEVSGGVARAEGRPIRDINLRGFAFGPNGASSLTPGQAVKVTLRKGDASIEMAGRVLRAGPEDTAVHLEAVDYEPLLELRLWLDGQQLSPRRGLRERP